MLLPCNRSIWSRSIRSFPRRGNLDSLSGVLDSSSGLLSKLASSQEELQTLTELMGSSTDAVKLLKEVSSLLDSLKKQGITLTEDDIRVMVDALVDKKAMEIAAEKQGFPRNACRRSSMPVQTI